MWETAPAACGCKIRVGRIEAVGTATKWAGRPSCCFAEPLSGKFDEFGRAIMDGTTEAVFAPCRVFADYRVILDGGPMVNANDNLVCSLHLEPHKAQLIQQTKELAEIYCEKCFKINLQLEDIELPAEEVCNCETI